MAFVPILGRGAAAGRTRAQCARARARTVVLSAKGIEALIFDCDGVLADTERDAHRVAFNIAFEENNLNTVWSEERYGKLLEVGGGKERMTAHFNEVGWPEGYDSEEEQKNLVKNLHLRKTELFGQLVQQGRIPLRPGVKDLAEEASKRGLPLAVCSTSNEKAVAQIVAMMGPGLSEKVKIFAGDVVPKKKPAPDIYNLAKEQLKLDPKTTVVVEDSYIGLEAAKEAGMNCVITKSTYTVDEDFSRADKVVDDLASSNTTIDTLNELVQKA